MWNSAAMQTGADAMTTAYPYLSLHTAGDVTSSADESSAPRQLAGWTPATADGDVSFSGVQFTGGASKGPVVRVGYWSAASAGSYGGGAMIPPDQDLAFNADGEYTLTTGTENGSAS